MLQELWIWLQLRGGRDLMHEYRDVFCEDLEAPFAIW